MLKVWKYISFDWKKYNFITALLNVLLSFLDVDFENAGFA